MNEFIDIKGFEGIFAINKNGSIKRLPTYILINGKYEIYKEATYVKSCIAENGYVVANLFHKGKFKIAYVHRLIAEVFIPNPDNKPYVNHLDGIRHNYSINNLEWCTQSENQLHAYSRGLQIPLKGSRHHWFGKEGNRLGHKGELAPNAKIILDTSTGIYYFGSPEASKVIGMKENTLRHMLNGSRKNKTSLIIV